MLNAEGQTVDITMTDWKVEIQVTAPNQVSKNTYTLRFAAPMSNNAHLQMIYLNTDSLVGFTPNQYNYFIDLPVGQTTMPEIYPISQESTQTIIDSITGEWQHTIFVTAEDGTTQQYLLAFQRTYSDADTLLAIYADGILIDGFQPDSLYYMYSLPVGTEYIPELSWQEADQWQSVTLSQPYNTTTKQINQIEVVAGSGKKNVYTITYEIIQSAVDTLKTIFAGADELYGYEAYTTEYYVNLAPGDSIAPNVTWQEGDIYQVVTPQTVPYIINNTQKGWKTVLSVQAQDGHNRIYTIYFLFSQVLSNNTDLLSIYLDGEPMSNFDPATHMYRVNVPYGEQKPFVFAKGAEPMQTIEYSHGDTTKIVVTAEDQTTTETYTLIFIYQQSSYAYLSGIYQDGSLIDGFHIDSLEYEIILPYGTTTLPAFTYEIGIKGQTVSVDTITSTTTNGQSVTYYSFLVTAPDQETSIQYDVYITVALNNDCSLQTLLINGVEISNFHSDTIYYQLIYPVGTDSTELITEESITAIANDANAKVQISTYGNNFAIQVDAHDGLHSRVYTIEQIILLSDNARLAAIYLDNELVRDFDADILEYEYYVGASQPFINAVAEDSTAIVEYGFYVAGEPYNIYVTAQDGTERIYTIYFTESTLQTSAKPTKDDVLIKHIGGLNFAVATLRKNVSFALYSMNGHLIYNQKITESNQNDIVVGTQADGSDKFLDIYSSTTQFSLPEANKIFFYVFFENSERKITSGKLVVTQ